MIKLLSLFSGIGAFEKALSNINEPYQLVNYCEIDKYAAKAYSLIHGVDESKNLHDVTKIDTTELPNDIDLITYGFPCQDISLAGKQTGFIDDDGNLTRSGLFFEALRIIEDCKPKIAIAENVKALVGSKFKTEFNVVLNSLANAGYSNYWAVLNAKDYGIPQNRERVFIVSIRKDIDHGFNFPKKYELKLRLKDILETDVEEKYYLSEERINNLIENNIDHKNTNELIMEGLLNSKGQEITRRVYNPEGIAPTLNTMQGGNRQPKIICCATSRGRGENNAQQLEYRFDDSTNSLTTVQKDNYIVETVIVKNAARKIKKKTNIACCLAARDYKGFGKQEMNAVLEYNTTDDLSIRKPIELATNKTICLNSKGGRNGIKGLQPSLQNRIYSDEGIITSITTCYRPKICTTLRIRKLTPKECFRLMGFSDCDIDILIENGISNTQLYKMAGNSIVVDVLEELFVELLNQYENVFPVGD